MKNANLLLSCLALTIATMVETPLITSAAKATTPISPEMRDGKRFTVEVYGEGQDVIFIPGLSSPRDVWYPSLSAIGAVGYRRHVIQIRGFGDAAGANAEGPVLDPFIAELADYIDDEIIGKGRPAPAIVGHSLGGLSALMIAARHPKLAGKIMIIDALPFIGTIFGAKDIEAVRAQATQMAAMIRKSPAKPPLDCNDPAVAEAVQSIWSNSAKGRCLVENWSRKSDPNVTAQAMLDDTLTDMRPELSKITAPVTLLYAQDDRAFPEAMARSLFEGAYKGTTNFNPVMVKGSYHFIMLDQPEKFTAELRAFLELKPN